MKNAFSTLEDAWWKTRKGWKLNIRAEYHNRLVKNSKICMIVNGDSR